jgi:hypothetical protein
MKRTNYFLIFSCLLVLGCTGAKKLTNAGNDDKGWKQLFNGTDIKDWFVKINHHLVGENYGNTFRVEDGIIKIRYDQYGDFDNQFGTCTTKLRFHIIDCGLNTALSASSKKARPTIPC